MNLPNNEMYLYILPLKMSFKKKKKNCGKSFYFIETSSAKHTGHIANCFSRSFIKSQIKGTTLYNISTDIIWQLLLRNEKDSQILDYKDV